MNKNYWPHFIIALVVFTVALGVWTVKTAIDNPVEIDDSYMMSYQELDKNIYKIQQMKRKFQQRYQVRLLTKKLDFPDAHIEFEILTKDGKPVKDAKVEVLLTRPETKKRDIKTQARYVDGRYVVEAKLPLEGRWNLLLKITIEDLVDYEKYKLSTRRVIEQKA